MDIFSVTAVHFKTYLFTTYFYSGHYGIGMVSKRMYFKVHFQVIHWHYTMGHVLNQKGVRIQFGHLTRDFWPILMIFQIRVLCILLKVFCRTFFI